LAILQPPCDQGIRANPPEKSTHFVTGSNSLDDRNKGLNVAASNDDRNPYENVRRNPLRRNIESDDDSPLPQKTEPIKAPDSNSKVSSEISLKELIETLERFSLACSDDFRSGVFKGGPEDEGLFDGSQRTDHRCG
jgi:hypothetical protein